MEETGFGVLEDKVIKNYIATEFLYDYLKDKKSVGVIDEDPEHALEYVAEPIGVILALLPITNPTSTALFKSIVCAKTRNALIMRPSAAAARCAARAGELLQEADGRMIKALRVFAQTIDLNSAVDRDRQERQDDPDRLGDVFEGTLAVLVDHADRLLVLQVVVEELGGDVVLEHLVLEHPEPGLLHRQLGELDGVLEPRDRHRPHDRRRLPGRARAAREALRALDVAVQPCGPLGVRRGGRIIRGGGIIDCRGHGGKPRPSRATASSGPSPAGSRTPSSSQR